MFKKPLKHYEQYVDKYFLRAKTVLEKEHLDPTVLAQVFIRRGNCKVYGIGEALQFMRNYLDFTKDGKIWTACEGKMIDNCGTVMLIEAPIQSIIALETIYLGLISAETTLRNKEEDIDLKSIQENMSKIKDLVKDRPVSYFGARHWRYDRDYEIALAAKKGGATNCSTDAGAKAWGDKCKGIGTIPHVLETIYHFTSGIEKAVLESTKAFDEHMPMDIPRTALVDYSNRELIDTILIQNKLRHRLDGIRIDTCGENVMEGAWGAYIPSKPYWFGTGVTVSGVYNIAKARERLNHKYKIILSSGFGNIEKVKAFVEAEKELGIKLFDGLGVGGLYKSRMATMDVVRVSDQKISKTGRGLLQNKGLRRVF